MSKFKTLAHPFPADRISWRVGSTNAEKTKGLALAYIDARDVMDRLDTVLGPENWQCKYSHANGKTVCDIGIKCGEEWIWKADGAGDSDIEAEKGALSDAFKRAAVRWGIGRYLYGFGNTWVELEQRGKSSVIKESEYKKLERVAAGEAVKFDAPKEKTPEEREAEFITAINEAKTEAELEKIWPMSQRTQKPKDPERHARVLAVFNKKQEELLTQGGN
jgi:hypothetical protein